jgi:hypothetical protein
MFGGQIAFIVSVAMIISSAVLYNFAYDDDSSMLVKASDNENFWAIGSGAILGSVGAVLCLAGIAMIIVNRTKNNSR